jgi:hypothetical protein
VNDHTSPEQQPADERRERYATAISKWHRDPEQPLYTQGADAVIALADTEQAELRERVADYENRITWHTTCGSCARILDSSIRETEQTEAQRLALSEALGLGTGAPWGAIRERAAELAAAASAVRPPATDRTALRERIIQALYDARRPGLGGMTEADAVAHMAAAVLAVLPEPADRAAVLREAADRYAELADQNEAYELAEHGKIDHETRLQYEAVRDVVAGLRRMAAEPAAAGPDQTRPSCPDPIECGHEAALGLAEMRLDQIRAQAAEWTALAPADDWGDTPQDTQLADVGRYLLGLLDGAKPDAASDSRANADVPAVGGAQPC